MYKIYRFDQQTWGHDKNALTVSQLISRRTHLIRRANIMPSDATKIKLYIEKRKKFTPAVWGEASVLSKDGWITIYSFSTDKEDMTFDAIDLRLLAGLYEMMNWELGEIGEYFDE